MIVGNGLIAKAFAFYNIDTHIIFASGVSNSLETDPLQFKREEDLLLKYLNEYSDKVIVYFSSFVDSDPRKGAYAAHKEHMKQIITSSKNNYIIIVLPQVIGVGGNQNTLINYIVNKIKNDEEINVYKDTYKALIDADDVVKIFDRIYKWKILNVYFEMPFIQRLFVEDIVKIIAKQLNKEPKINLVKGQINANYKLSLAAEGMIDYLEIDPDNYIEQVIKKYVK